MGPSQQFFSRVGLSPQGLTSSAGRDFLEPLTSITACGLFCRFIHQGSGDCPNRCIRLRQHTLCPLSDNITGTFQFFPLLHQAVVRRSTFIPLMAAVKGTISRGGWRSYAHIFYVFFLLPTRKPIPKAAITAIITGRGVEPLDSGFPSSIVTDAFSS